MKPRKKYRVKIHYTSYEVREVYAPNPDKAMELAESGYGHLVQEYESQEDTEVQEIKNG